MLADLIYNEAVALHDPSRVIKDMQRFASPTPVRQGNGGLKRCRARGDDQACMGPQGERYQEEERQRSREAATWVAALSTVHVGP